MRKTECGQMTVFLSLLLISFLLILSVCVEGIYIQMKSADFAEQQMVSGEYAQANYHRELLEQFHLFAIDGRYYAKMESSLKRNWEQNMGIQPEILKVSNIIAITENEAIIKHQIREYMKYKETTDILNSLKKSFQGVGDDTQTKDLKNKLETIEDETTQLKKDDLQNEKIDVKEDPRKGLSELLSGGILNLVMSNREISTKTISIVYGKENSKKDKTVDFFHKKSVAAFLEDMNKDFAINQIASDGLTVSYVGLVCRNATNKNVKEGMQYEMEYLIAGKNSDQKNLQYVVNRLLLLRFGLNYSHLLSSGKKQAEAYALATQIANITATVPGVVEGIKLLIMAAWAYGESVIDLRGLLKGNRIAVIKNEQNWQLSLSGLANLSAQEKQSENGITYQDYLQIILLLQSESKEKYKRMMDVIEQRIQEQQSDFLLSECVFAFQMTVGMKVPLLFYDTSYELKNERVYVY